MELEHDVVKDLYPLYIENDLSPSVKMAVDEHLKKCDHCSKNYNSSVGFSENLKELEKPVIANKVDEKIILKVKINQLKYLTMFLASIILTILILDYKNDREKLLTKFQDYFIAADFLPDSFAPIKDNTHSNLEYLKEDIFRIFEKKIILEENLNYFEKRELNNTEYRLTLHDDSFNKMLEIMEMRYDQGLWDKTDEAVYQKTQKYFLDFSKLLGKQENKLNHGYSSYFETLDIVEMDKFYKKINLLSDSYTRFHKLPEQLHPIGKSKLKKIIARKLNVSVSDVKILKNRLSEIPFNYEFVIQDKYNGWIDGYNGQITTVNGNHGLSDGQVMTTDNAKKKAHEHLQNIYGDKISFNLVSLGFNYNYEFSNSDFKVHSFRVVPVLKGYKFYTRYNEGTIIHIDSDTGKLRMLSLDNRIGDLNEFPKTDLTIKISKEKLQNKNLTDTVIIYSELTGKFELVYMNPRLEDFEKEKFYSTKGNFKLSY
ncbi:MAG: hypothetical protein K0S51_1125 [Bacillales bacterium]|jgi:hypothetical protein|nr:hypothetical protein [Bacillales bacterium]